ncbi:MAG: hypothetical protein L3J75_05940 [Methylococcaceae bacterium]|nr:hypothetical protein [Methylococcaceae bacterium]
MTKFLQLCSGPNASEAIKKTINAIKQQLGSDDCTLENEALLAAGSLNLGGYNLS